MTEETKQNGSPYRLRDDMEYAARHRAGDSGVYRFCSFGYTFCGPSAIVIGVEDALAKPGQAVRFIVAPHPKEVEPGMEQKPPQFVTVATGSVDGAGCLRFCGENGDPEGAGSHSVIMSGLDISLDRAHLAATLTAIMYRMMPGGWVFRDLRDFPEFEK